MAEKKKKSHKPGPGRPKDLEKRSDILKAAGDLFMDKGFAGTTMDDIASAAGVSKLTVYNHFGTKEDLFSDVIHAKCEQFTGEDLFEKLEGKDPARELFIVGSAFIKLIFSNEAVSMHRLMMTDGVSNPTLGLLFYKAGPQRLYDRFIKYLGKLEKNTNLKFSDKPKSATLFFDLFKGDRHMRALLNIPPEKTDREMTEFIKDCTDFFIKAHAQ